MASPAGVRLPTWLDIVLNDEKYIKSRGMGSDKRGDGQAMEDEFREGPGARKGDVSADHEEG